jgi:phage regulator Rha-like protein
MWINKDLFKNYITSNAIDSTSFEINSWIDVQHTTIANSITI